MIIKNVSTEDLRKALSELNKRYDDNIIWNNYHNEGRGYRVTLRVQDSHGKGARLHYNKDYELKRHSVSACWHVHGDFFDILLSINPDAVIKTAKHTIDKDGGNWEDWNIGSVIYPLYYSEACEC